VTLCPYDLEHWSRDQLTVNIDLLTLINDILSLVSRILDIGGDTLVQLLALYTDPESHSVQHWRRTD